MKKIKEKAINTSDLAKSRLPIERVRKESEHLDAEIDNVRSKLKEREVDRSIDDFFNFVDEKKEVRNIIYL